MSLLGWKEACEDMNDEKFQDAMNKVRQEIAKSPNQAFWKGYERTVDQSSSMAEELEFFLRDFPSLRLGQIIAAIVPSTKDNNLELFNIYDEELIRRLRIYGCWLNEEGPKPDWVTYLSENMGDTK